jgi:hyperosmotically inducible protein
VNNLLEVAPTLAQAASARSDAEVKAGIEKQLNYQHGLATGHVGVKSVDKGVVLLTGKTDTYDEYLRVLTATYRVAGVKSIVSQVKTPGDFSQDEQASAMTDTQTKVDSTAAQVKSVTSDLRISTEVKMRLLISPQVPAIDISVDTDDGIVTLFGKVPAAEVKDAISAEAAKVAGVREVDNQLEVAPGSLKPVAEVDDAEIARAIALAFKAHPELVRVTPSVNGGAIRLTGSVPTQWDELNALRIARRAAGARSVEHQLVLRDSASQRVY